MRTPAQPDSADDELLGRLPAAYAEALRMRRRGESGEAIAIALAIEPSAVASLLVLAEAKLAALEPTASGDDGIE